MVKRTNLSPSEVAELEYLRARTATLENQINMLAEKQGYTLTETSDGVFEFIKSDEQLPEGDYLNPIPYVSGMTVTTGKFYTDGEDIWEAIKDGVPTGFDDTEYFDIIIV